MKKIILENIKTIFYALVIAILIRSLLLQPFYIPSSSMEPSLLVGDRLFVTKLSYGYSKHSFPFSLGPIKNRIFFSEPKRGDVIVFKTPADNRTDYIKRLLGLPGDKLQFIEGNLYLNNVEILKSKIKYNSKIYCGKSKVETNVFKEKLLNGREYLTTYYVNGSYQNSDEFIVPPDHYFFLGDNRDCSKDSRFLSSVGFVHKNNLVGKAQFIFFSTDITQGSAFDFWNWKNILRIERFFKKIV
jgi:signal peptidase I|tara:strand:- start:215 stop:943 length:729 start_codon:yes stop_codon:yes gene_type:complete